MAVTIGIVGSACGGRGQQEVATAWGFLCSLTGKLAVDLGTSAVVGRTVSWEGVGSDLLFLTGPSVAATAVVAVCICLWGPRKQLRLVCAPGGHVGGALPPVSTQRKKLLWRGHPSPCTPPNNGPLPL